MDMKAQANKNAAASQQAACTPSGCKSCERKGVAIYPLRVAAVPASLVNTGWYPAVPHQDTELKGGEFKYALRTLREGYVYILADKQVWYAYQVTPQGFLRMFNANEMPEGGNVEPLSTACLQQNHDIRSSFINVDPKYSHVAVAFSNDPWPREVLAKYKQAEAPAPRFTQVTIMGGKTATIEGTGRSLTLDPTLSTLTKNVLEFATEKFPSIVGKEGQPDGAYGFYPRRDIKKQTVLGNKVAELQELYGVVHAIVLDDVVGVIQELNSARMDVVKVMTDYLAKTENRHKKMISDAILQIRAGMAEKIATDPTIRAIPGKYPISRVKRVSMKTQDAMERLEDYYHESARAEFVAGYQSTADGYQRKLKSVVQDLSSAYQSVFWHTVIEHDYAPETSVISWAALLGMLAGNFHGGMVGMDKSDNAADGGKTVWLSWMQDPKSPPYRALLAGRKDLPTSVYDGTMTYANLKTLLNSDEMGRFLNSDAFRQTTSSLVMSLNGALSQLSSLLSEKAEAGFVRTMSALACAAGEEPMVAVYSGEMTVRDYQNVVRKPLNAHGQSVLTQRFENADSITSASRAGHWPEITDPLILERKIQVKLVAPLKTVDSLAFKQAVRKAGTSASAIKSGNLLKNSGQLAGLPDLTPEIVSHSLTTGEISLSAADMRRVAGFQFELPPSFYAGSLGVVLAGVMLGFQIHTMNENIKSLKTRLPDSQAVMSLGSGTLLMIAAGAEIVGQVYTMFQASKEMVHPMLKVAGVIGGVAVVIDGVSLLMKSSDVRATGDTTAADYYKAAGFVSIVAGGFGIAFGFVGNFALFSEAFILGPVGWCIALGLVALILTSVADSNVRSPLERWLTHTCFGTVEKRGGKEKAWNAASLSDLQEAMKELHTIASGVSAQLVRDRVTEFLFNSTISGTKMVSVLATLPDYSQSGSDWLVELTATGSGVREVLARNGSTAKLAGQAKPVPQTVELTHIMSMNAFVVPPAIKVTSAPALDERLITAGTSKMLQLSGEYPLNTQRFTGMELNVSYWPDKTYPEEILQLSAAIDSQ
ncbi:hypothetical protein JK154_17340 [Citrobacter sp. JGM124]|nr:hypothetical protein [Citrobacter sp. JGM124]